MRFATTSRRQATFAPFVSSRSAGAGARSIGLRAREPGSINAFRCTDGTIGNGRHPGTLPALRERHGDALSLEAPINDLIR